MRFTGNFYKMIQRNKPSLEKNKKQQTAKSIRTAQKKKQNQNQKKQKMRLFFLAFFVFVFVCFCFAFVAFFS